MHTDRCGNTRRQKCCANGSGKNLKYKSLCIEIQRMLNLKCTIIPVIIGATGIVTRSLRKNMEAVPGKHSIDSLQKTAVLGTSHIIRKVLQCEAWSLSGGDHCWFKRITRKKTPVTRNIIIIIITDKQNKYQEQANEICAMWKQNAAQLIPIAISSTGLIPKSLSQSLQRLNLYPNTYIQMQKCVILGTCSIVRNFKTINKTIKPNPVDYYIPRHVNIFQLQLRSEKFDMFFFKLHTYLQTHKVSNFKLLYSVVVR
jgi:hypothetical protein